MERRAMASEQINRPARGELTRRASTPLALWGRTLAVASAVVFCISSAFPVVAAFVRDTGAWPRWWGVLDVAIAFRLALLAFAVVGVAHGEVSKQAEDASYRAYRVLTYGVLVLLVVFFLFGDQIVWGNCLTGFAWRAWLLLYGLPSWFTAFGASRP